MADGQQNFGAMDSWTRMWTDMMGRMASAGATAPPAPKDVFEQMRTAFFDVLSRQAEEFMRSEAFLNTMKQSMDGALVFRKQINDFVAKGLESSQMPSTTDVEEIVRLVRNMEQRITDKMDDLSYRLEQLEGSGPEKGDRSTRLKPRGPAKAKSAGVRKGSR